MASRIDAESIIHYIDKDLRLRTVALTDSTNRLAKDAAAAGEPEGLVIIAERQTAGRGRLGRSFFSPDGTGLYMSLLLRPQGGAEDTVRLTTVAAVAAARAVEEICGRTAGIKWVNDIYVDGRKVCGILCEAGFGAAGAQWVVVGAGFNIAAPEGGFPEALRDIAGALFGAGEAPELARERLAAAFLRHFMPLYRAPGAYFAEYRRRLTVLGQDVTVHTPQGSYPARAVDVDEACRLLVQKPDGETVYLETGEISVRPAGDAEQPIFGQGEVK